MLNKHSIIELDMNYSCMLLMPYRNFTTTLLSPEKYVLLGSTWCCVQTIINPERLSQSTNQRLEHDAIPNDVVSCRRWMFTHSYSSVCVVVPLLLLLMLFSVWKCYAYALIVANIQIDRTSSWIMCVTPPPYVNADRIIRHFTMEARLSMWPR